MSATVSVQIGQTFLPYDAPESCNADLEEIQKTREQRKASEELNQFLAVNPKTSILRSKCDPMERQRRDFYGTMISHKKGQQKVKFKDNVDEINEVENWKEYNVNHRTCECNLF